MNLVALRSASFRLYYCGNVAAVNGMWILQILIIWLAWDVTGSASFVGMIGAFALFPTVLSGPFFGVAVDRMNIRIAAYGTNLGMVLVALTLLAVQGTGAMNPVWLSMIAAALGVVKSAHHPYTRGLMGAIPSLDGTGDRLTQIPGSMPRLSAIPQGCAFNPRCPHAFDRCRTERPDPIPIDNSHVACWLTERQAAEAQQ